MDKPSTIPEVIRTIRGALELTQAELAERVRVTVPSIYRYESGKSIPNPATLKALYEIAEDLGQEEAIYILGRELASRFSNFAIHSDQAAVEAFAAQTEFKPLTLQRLARGKNRKEKQALQPVSAARVPELSGNVGDQTESKAATWVRTALSEAQSCLQLNLFASALLMSRNAIETTIWLAFPNENRQISDIISGLSRLCKANLIDMRLFEWGKEIVE